MTTLAGIAPQCEMGDVQSLLSPSAARDILVGGGLDVTGVELGYLRVKPGAGALVGMTMDAQGQQGEQVRLPAYVRTTSSAGRAAALAAKWGGVGDVTPLGPAVRLLPGGRSVLFVFPVDSRLRGLQTVVDIGKLKRCLAQLEGLGPPGFVVRARRSSLTLLRYKPERRLVAWADLGLLGDDGWRGQRGVMLRYFYDRRGAALADLASRLARSSVGALVPKPIGTLLDGRLFVEEHLPGAELAEATLAGDAEAEPVARALLELHRSRVPLGPARRPGSLLASAARGLRTVTLVAPALRTPVEQVMARLGARLVAAAAAAAAGAAGGPVPVHGDLHLHQVILTASGPVFVDLERAACDDPLVDLAGLAAHLRILAHRKHARAGVLRKFEEGLIETYLSGARPSAAGDLGFAIACGLVQQALLAARRLERDWQLGAAKALSLAESALDEFRPRLP